MVNQIKVFRNKQFLIPLAPPGLGEICGEKEGGADLGGAGGGPPSSVGGAKGGGGGGVKGGVKGGVDGGAKGGPDGRGWLPLIGGRPSLPGGRCIYDISEETGC